MALKLKFETSSLSHTKITYRIYIKYSFETSRTYNLQVTVQNMEKCLERVTRVGVYGPHTLVKCLFKALISGTCKKNMLILPR